MKKVASRQTPFVRAKRLNVSEAKAKFSQALRDVEDSPIVVHNRGHDVAVLVSIDEYERLVDAGRSNDEPTMKSFLEAVDELKRKFGGGAELPGEAIAFTAIEPFARRKR